MTLQTSFIHRFLSRNALHTADYTVARCLSICVSVCPSVCHTVSDTKYRAVSLWQPSFLFIYFVIIVWLFWKKRLLNSIITGRLLTLLSWHYFCVHYGTGERDTGCALDTLHRSTDGVWVRHSLLVVERRSVLHNAPSTQLHARLLASCPHRIYR